MLRTMLHKLVTLSALPNADEFIVPAAAGRVLTNRLSVQSWKASRKQGVRKQFCASADLFRIEQIR